MAAIGWVHYAFAQFFAYHTNCREPIAELHIRVVAPYALR
jgi:hypothetical protein